MTTIVVPLDGSVFAERALRPGCSIAAALDHARVLLVSCATDDLDVVRQRLDDRAEMYSAVVDVETRLVTDGDPDDVILATIAAEPDALLCMATHGRGGVRATVLGSVAEQVVRRSTQPLVLVGPHCRSALLPGERGRLLACTDGSALSDNIVPTVATWCDRLQLEPWLTEVVPPDEYFEYLGRPARHRRVEAAAARLDKLAPRLASPATAANTEVLHGAPSRAIVDFAERLPAALIAMATHGRSGPTRITLGSVAADVVRSAPCPVLLARPTDPPASMSSRDSVEPPVAEAVEPRRPPNDENRR